MQFQDLNLCPELMRAIEQADFTTPTPIQAQSIPLALAGDDVMACAQTGTGKTAAFTLPTLHRLMTNMPESKQRLPRVVILTPTRELAAQIVAAIQTFTKNTPIKTTLLVGGTSYGPQISSLQRPLDIIVATPGRFIDHFDENRLNLSQVETVVLDEADRMLDMGFAKPVEKILAQTPKGRQTLLFSATFSKEVEALARQFMHDPKQVRLASAQQNHDQITQQVFFTKAKEEKIQQLRSMLENRDIWQAIVFIRTKHAADKMAKQIKEWGHSAAALHGDMKQNARNRVVKEMHNGKVRVLVATDVAARGLDVKELTHVINFDLPQVAEDYIHRIGRTGRAGAEGFAISFASREEMPLLRDIERLLNQEIEALNERPQGRSGGNAHNPRTAGRRVTAGRSQGSRDGGGRSFADRKRRSGGSSSAGRSDESRDFNGRSAEGRNAPARGTSAGRKHAAPRKAGRTEESFGNRQPQAKEVNGNVKENRQKPKAKRKNPDAGKPRRLKNPDRYNNASA